MTGDQLGGIIRLVMAAAGGYALSLGFTATQWEAVAGGAAVLAAGLWSYFSKKKTA